jgi:hypothetical protein
VHWRVTVGRSLKEGVLLSRRLIEKLDTSTADAIEVRRLSKICVFTCIHVIFICAYIVMYVHMVHAHTNMCAVQSLFVE